MFKKIVALVLLCLCLALPASAQISLTTEWEHVSKVPDFSDLYLVCRDGLWGISRRDGELLFEPQFRYEPEFQSGYAVVARLDPLTRGGFSDAEEYGSLYGVISAEGEIVIPLEYEHVSLLEGSSLALVQLKYRSDYRYAFFNMQGENLTGFKYSRTETLLSGYTCVAVSDDSSPERELWGLIGPDGRELLPAQYAEIELLDGFSETVIGARLPQSNAFQQYELKYGKLYPLYENSGDAADALLDEWDAVSQVRSVKDAFLVCKNEKWGMVRSDGEVILEAKFLAKPEFVGNYAVVTLPDPQPREGLSGETEYGCFYGLIDSSGSFVLPAEYDDLQLNDDASMVMMELKGKIGFLNLSDGTRIALQYDRAAMFTGDYAAVGHEVELEDDRISIDSGVRWGTIDRSGKVCIPLEYEEMCLCDNGIALVYLNSNRSGKNYFYLKPDGTRLTTESYSAAQAFVGKRAAVAIETPVEGGDEEFVSTETLWGMIDSEGHAVVPCRYDELEVCENGFALVYENASYGFINADGEIIAEPKYARARAFEGGYAAVARETTPFANDEDASLLWGLIDESGNEVLPLEYDAVGFYPDGTVAASIDGTRLRYEIKNGEAIEISAVQSPKASL